MPRWRKPKDWMWTADCLPKTTWKLPKRGAPIVERWYNLTAPEEWGMLKLNYKECVEFLQDQYEGSWWEYTPREWFYVMKTDFENEFRYKSEEATQNWIMQNALIRLYKEWSPKEKRYRNK